MRDYSTAGFEINHARNYSRQRSRIYNLVPAPAVAPPNKVSPPSMIISVSTYTVRISFSRSATSLSTSPSYFLTAFCRSSSKSPPWLPRRKIWPSLPTPCVGRQSATERSGGSPCHRCWASCRGPPRKVPSRSLRGCSCRSCDRARTSTRQAAVRGHAWSARSEQQQE